VQEALVRRPFLISAAGRATSRIKLIIHRSTAVPRAPKPSGPLSVGRITKNQLGGPLPTWQEVTRPHFIDVPVNIDGLVAR
jgi:hypothetical protein